MDTENIIRELEDERDKLNTAIAALQGSGNATRKKKRHMSDEAKLKQSLAAKRRWKAAKKAGRNKL
jgi:hypothetical protein